MVICKHCTCRNNCRHQFISAHCGVCVCLMPVGLLNKRALTHMLLIAVPFFRPAANMWRRPKRVLVSANKSLVGARHRIALESSLWVTQHDHPIASHDAVELLSAFFLADRPSPRWRWSCCRGTRSARLLCVLPGLNCLDALSAHAGSPTLSASSRPSRFHSVGLLNFAAPPRFFVVALTGRGADGSCIEVSRRTPVPMLLRSRQVVIKYIF